MSRCILLYMFESWRKKAAPQEAPKSSEVLNGWDRAMLEEGLTNVIDQMLKDFDGRLPEAILLPDTSARPLFFALQPVLKRLAEIKKISEPRCYAFNSKRPDSTIQLAEKFNSMRGNDEPINTETEIKASLIEAGMPGNVMSSMMEAAQPDEMKEARDVMKERVAEILRHEVRFGNSANIVVLDESITENATTAKEIRRAFDMPDMHVYAVVAQQTEGIQAGIVIDPFDTETMNPDKNFSARFSYSGTDAVGVVKPEGPHEKFSKRVPYDPAGVVQGRRTQLQAEMRAVGEKIADNLEKKLRESQTV